MQWTQAEKRCAVPTCGSRQFGNRGQIADANVARPSQARDLARKSPCPAALELFRLVAAPRRNDEERFRASVAGMGDELVVAAFVVFDTRATFALTAILKRDLPFHVCVRRGANRDRAVRVRRNERRDERAAHLLHGSKRVARRTCARNIEAEALNDRALCLFGRDILVLMNVGIAVSNPEQISETIYDIGPGAHGTELHETPVHGLRWM